jgi:hypothetical protein
MFKMALKKYFPLIFCIFLLVSCQETKDELTLEFNEEITINDLLNKEEFKSLNIDEEYKNYINDYWDNNIELHKTGYKISEFLAESKFSEKKNNLETVDEAQSAASYALSGMKTVGAMTIDGLQLMALENDKKKIYTSFSITKKEKADQFQKKIFDVLNKSSIKYPANKNVKEVDSLQNYKSFTNVIKNDSDLYDTLDELTNDVDDLFILGLEIRIKQNLNLELGSKENYKALTDYGNKIINSNGNFDVSTQSELLDNYFNLLCTVLKDIERIKQKKYAVPFEDWSESKKTNFNFILNDIEVKLKNDVFNFTL